LYKRSVRTSPIEHIVLPSQKRAVVCYVRKHRLLIVSITQHTQVQRIEIMQSFIVKPGGTYFYH